MSASECPECGFALNLQAGALPECLLCGYVEGELPAGVRLVDRPRSRRPRTQRRRPPMPWRYPRHIDRR